MAELREPLSEEESKTTTNLVRGGRLVELPGAYDPEKPDYLLLSHTAPIKMLPPQDALDAAWTKLPYPPPRPPSPPTILLSVVGHLVKPEDTCGDRSCPQSRGGTSSPSHISPRGHQEGSGRPCKGRPRLFLIPCTPRRAQKKMKSM